MIGCSHSTAKVHLFKARRRLATILGEDFRGGRRCALTDESATSFVARPPWWSPMSNDISPSCSSAGRRDRLDTVAPMLIAATAVAIVVLAGAPFCSGSVGSRLEPSPRCDDAHGRLAGGLATNAPQCGVPDGGRQRVGFGSMGSLAISAPRLHRHAEQLRLPGGRLEMRTDLFGADVCTTLPPGRYLDPDRRRPDVQPGGRCMCRAGRVLHGRRLADGSG